MHSGTIADRGTKALLHGVHGLEKSWFAQPVLHNVRGAGCRALSEGLRQCFFFDWLIVRALKAIQCTKIALADKRNERKKSVALGLCFLQTVRTLLT